MQTQSPASTVKQFILTTGTTLALAAAALAQPQLLINAPKPLSYLRDPATGSNRNPEITTDGMGNWIAVWTSTQDLNKETGTDADILFAKTINDGITWTFPAPLNTNADTDRSDDDAPHVVTDRNGVWIAVWHSAENLNQEIGPDNDILFARSIDAGKTWSDPAPLNTDADTDQQYDDHVPCITTDGQGNWIAVWNSNRTGADTDIRFATSADDAQTWTDPAFLNDDPDTDVAWDSSPQIITDARGTWIVAWKSYEDPPGQPATDQDLLFTRSIDNGQTWSLPGPLNANADIDQTKDAGFNLTADGNGNWVAVWQDLQLTDQTSEYDDDIHVTRSTDNGQTWSAPTPIHTNTGADDCFHFHANLATDMDGNWALVWDSEGSMPDTTGEDGDVFNSTSQDDGITWSTQAPLNTNAGIDQGTDRYPSPKPKRPCRNEKN